MTIVITPTLLMGTEEPSTDTWAYVRCETADEAYTVIARDDDKVAWIPREDEAAARDVLERLGADREWIDGLFLYARTGRVVGGDDPDRVLPPA